MITILGTGDTTKADEFLEKLQRGGVIFNPKIYVADYGPLTGLFEHENDEKLQHDFPKMRGVS